MPGIQRYTRVAFYPLEYPLSSPSINPPWTANRLFKMEATVEDVSKGGCWIQRPQIGERARLH